MENRADIKPKLLLDPLNDRKVSSVPLPFIEAPSDDLIWPQN